MLATVDAAINTDLKKYLKGGYPTVRVFSKGKLGDKYFVGNKSESAVRRFIDSIKQSSPVNARTLEELKTSTEFSAISE